MGLSSFKCLWYRLQTTHLFWNRVRISRSRWFEVDDFDTIRKRVCDFLVVRPWNHGFYIAQFMRYDDLLAENCTVVTHLLFGAPARYVPFGFLLTRLLRRVMGLSSSEDCMIAEWVILTQYQCGADSQAGVTLNNASNYLANELKNTGLLTLILTLTLVR